MLKTLHKLWVDTVRDKDPEHTARVYLVTPEGETAHAVVGGDSKAHIQEIVLEALPSGSEVNGIKKYKEGEINHPLRG